MGALDVCPFIPVRGVTMDECVHCAQAFGQRLAEELGVPGECPGRRPRLTSAQQRQQQAPCEGLRSNILRNADFKEKTIPRRFLTGRNMFPFSYDENL